MVHWPFTFTLIPLVGIFDAIPGNAEKVNCARLRNRSAGAHGFRLRSRARSSRTQQVASDSTFHMIIRQTLQFNIHGSTH